ncbi:MAG TPA: hypothetical protein VM347_35515 [Nonomuraea sp.]|nr:hypothetical protein [Nonomuraea sp.]
MRSLEARYRQILAWYPQDHRERHCAALLLFLPAAALGDLGNLPSVPASVALVQIGCLLSAFAMGTVLVSRRESRASASPEIRA